MNHCRSVLVSISACLLLLGCEAKLDRPDFDPQWSSSKALEQCDANSDGQIDPSEAAAAPGLLMAFDQWDTNGDKLISGDEFGERIAKYKASAGSVASAGFTVTYKKKPLPGAEVILDPEPFMGEGFAPAKGTTDRRGYVSLNRPDMGDGGYPGVYLGLYRVRISKQEGGKELLAEKYNTASELGFDSGGQTREARTSPRFDLE
ncbi:MAG: hypothetical protein RH917_15290 [Lacipirellulaceae bacterium]